MVFLNRTHTILLLLRCLKLYYKVRSALLLYRTGLRSYIERPYLAKIQFTKICIDMVLLYRDQSDYSSELYKYDCRVRWQYIVVYWILT